MSIGNISFTDIAREIHVLLMVIQLLLVVQEGQLPVTELRVGTPLKRTLTAKEQCVYLTGWLDMTLIVLTGPFCTEAH